MTNGTGPSPIAKDLTIKLNFRPLKGLERVRGSTHATKVMIVTLARIVWPLSMPYPTPRRESSAPIVDMVMRDRRPRRWE